MWPACVEHRNLQAAPNSAEGLQGELKGQTDRRGANLVRRTPELTKARFHARALNVPSWHLAGNPAAPVFVRYWATADISGFPGEMVCPLMTQIGHRLLFAPPPVIERRRAAIRLVFGYDSSASSRNASGAPMSVKARFIASFIA